MPVPGTANFNIPYMETNQAQKEVTFNDAMDTIDTALDGHGDRLTTVETGVSGTYPVGQASDGAGSLSSITIVNGRITVVATR